MPKNYDLSQTPANQQRRPENERDAGWIRTFLQRGQIAHIATRWDDQPFITPSTYWYDEAGNQIIFHSNIVGRIRANSERHPDVCVEVSEYGRFLPSNVALEFTVQYASVIIFGNIRLIENPEEKQAALYGLLNKYFPAMTAGQEYRPITDQELNRTSVYAIAIDSWSGKENWPEQAEQSLEWPLLMAEVIAGG
jgi:hypothetical protein